MDPIPKIGPLPHAMPRLSSPLLRALPTFLFLPLAALLSNAPLLSAEALAGLADSEAPLVGQVGGDTKDTKPERSAEEIEEYTVKAELLFSFLKYSKFPEGTFAHKKSPIVVLVIGDDPFGPLLKAAFAKKQLNGRSIQIRRLKRIPRRTYAHLVFAHGIDEKGQSKLINELCGRPCLLVADTPGFAEAGGFINLYSDEGKVRFEINASCMKTTGVQLKADFLKLARIITDQPAPAEKQS